MEMSVDQDNAAAAGVFFGGRCDRSHRNHVCLCGDYLRQGLAAAPRRPVRSAAPRLRCRAPCADPLISAQSHSSPHKTRTVVTS